MRAAFFLFLLITIFSFHSLSLAEGAHDKDSNVPNNKMSDRTEVERTGNNAENCQDSQKPRYPEVTNPKFKKLIKQLMLTDKKVREKAIEEIANTEPESKRERNNLIGHLLRIANRGTSRQFKTSTKASKTTLDKMGKKAVPDLLKWANRKESGKFVGDSAATEILNKFDKRGILNTPQSVQLEQINAAIESKNKKCATSAKESITPDKIKPKLELLKIEKNIVTYTNEQRKRYGLPPLKIDEDLVKSAREHAIWMTRNRNLQHTNKPMAENIAMGYPTSRSAVIGWMNSSGHRANILNRGYKTIGAAAYRTKSGTIYWCQQFRR